MKRDREMASRCAQDLMRYLHIMEDLKQRLECSANEAQANFEHVLKENDDNLSKVYGGLSHNGKLHHQVKNINYIFAIANHQLERATTEELGLIQTQQYKVINRTYEFYESMIGGVFNKNYYSTTVTN